MQWLQFGTINARLVYIRLISRTSLNKHMPAGQLNQKALTRFRNVGLNTKSGSDAYKI